LWFFRTVVTALKRENYRNRTFPSKRKTSERQGKREKGGRKKVISSHQKPLRAVLRRREKEIRSAYILGSGEKGGGEGDRRKSTPGMWLNIPQNHGELMGKDPGEKAETSQLEGICVPGGKSLLCSSSTPEAHGTARRCEIWRLKAVIKEFLSS